MLDYRNLKSEVATFWDGGDEWGDTLGWWFAIAGELHDRAAAIPAEWHYRPSPFGGVDPDDFRAPTCAEASDEALLRMGSVLHRYADRLKRHGFDY